MKTLKFAIYVLAFSFLFTACKENRGCTDKTALNYDEAADVNDGTCEYEVKLRMKFTAMSGTDTVKVNENYTSANGTLIKVSTLRFYISNIHLTTNQDEKILLKDVGLIDFDDFRSPSKQYFADNFIDLTTRLYNVKNVQFDLGLSDAINFGDPTLYDNDHPMGVQLFQHWSWSTGYIFVKIEGQSDSDGNGIIDENDKDFLIHTGTSPLFREGIKIEKNLSIRGDNKDEFNVIIDMNTLFNEIDLNDAFSHTMNGFELAEKFQNNMAASFKAN